MNIFLCQYIWSETSSYLKFAFFFWQGKKTPGCRFATESKFCWVFPNICGFSEKKLICISLLVCKIFQQPLRFLENFYSPGLREYLSTFVFSANFAALRTTYDVNSGDECNLLHPRYVLIRPRRDGNFIQGHFHIEYLVVHLC